VSLIWMGDRTRMCKRYYDMCFMLYIISHTVPSTSYFAVHILHTIKIVYVSFSFMMCFKDFCLVKEYMYCFLSMGSYFVYIHVRLCKTGIFNIVNLAFGWLVLYGPFCHVALKLDKSTLFTTFFLRTSLQLMLK